MNQDPLDTVTPRTAEVSCRAALLGIGGLASVLAFAVLDHAAAEDATPTPAYAPGVHPAILGRKAALAAPGHNLLLVRITFNPGSSVAPHTHPGDTVTYQLSGAHAYTVLPGPAYLVRTGSATPVAGEAGELMTVGQEYTVTPGDVLLIDASTAHSARNPTDQPAVLLEAQLRMAGEPLTLPMATPVT